MNKENLREIWKKEEAAAKICGWDFSHIEGRYEAENDLPWSYERAIKEHLENDMRLLDYDTGGGEFLLSLQHPFCNTSATEGYPPNVELCRKRLMPLGIDFKECHDPGKIPFKNGQFHMIINRHGGFVPQEIHRLLKKNGLFITQQVGENNDRGLVKMVLPGTPKPFPGQNLQTQKKIFESTGFRILRAEEAYRPIKFFDVGAFVWFARIIEWEFPGFSVDKCFNQLLKMEKVIAASGCISAEIHRFLIIADKD